MAQIGCVLEGVPPKGRKTARPSGIYSPHILFILEWWGSNQTGRVELSPDLMSEGEIDFYVKELKADLERAAKKAKRLLAAGRKRKAASLSR
jgi:hypothetical protein